LKIIVDMNLSKDWVPYLTARGHEVTHWKDIGAQAAEDSEIMEWCAKEGAVILTGDLDFSALHAARGTDKPSVVQLRTKDKLPQAQGPFANRALAVAVRYISRGAIVTIKGKRMRITRLPIVNTEPLF
jgi:predicted nuclease of predicted toxin-antitoxin system